MAWLNSIKQIKSSLENHLLSPTSADEDKSLKLALWQTSYTLATTTLDLRLIIGDAFASVSGYNFQNTARHQTAVRELSDSPVVARAHFDTTQSRSAFSRNVTLLELAEIDSH